MGLGYQVEQRPGADAQTSATLVDVIALLLDQVVIAQGGCDCEGRMIAFKQHRRQKQRRLWLLTEFLTQE